MSIYDKTCERCGKPHRSVRRDTEMLCYVCRGTVDQRREYEAYAREKAIKAGVQVLRQMDDEFTPDTDEDDVTEVMLRFDDLDAKVDRLTERIDELAALVSDAMRVVDA